MHPFFRLASSSRAATMAKGPLLPYYPALLRFPKPQNGFLNRVLVSDDFIFSTTAIIFLNLDSGLFFNALHAKNPACCALPAARGCRHKTVGSHPQSPKMGADPLAARAAGPVRRNLRAPRVQRAPQ